MSDFATMPRSVSESIHSRSLAMSSKLAPLAMRSRASAASSGILENDLANLAFLRFAVAILVLLEVALWRRRQ